MEGTDAPMATAHEETHLGNPSSGVDQAGTDPSDVLLRDPELATSAGGAGIAAELDGKNCMVSGDEASETDFDDLAKESAESSTLEELRLIVQSRSEEAQKAQDALTLSEIALTRDRSRGKAIEEQEASHAGLSKAFKAATMRLQAARSARVKKLDATSSPPAIETPALQVQKEIPQSAPPRTLDETPVEDIQPKSLEKQLEETSVLATDITSLSAQMVKLFYIQAQATRQLVAPLAGDIDGRTLLRSTKKHFLTSMQG